MDLHDTIVALSSAPGPGGRAVVRATGPRALSAALQVFECPDRPDAGERRRYEGHVRLPGVHSPLPADLYVWPAPATYTGQELVEIHTLSSPPLVELLVARLLDVGCRAARPGEFTLRAFLSGKLDLTRAEAVLGVIEARDRSELTEALTQLAGGVTRPLQAARDDLLNLLADVEASLDFAEEDVRFVGERELLERITNALAHVTLLQRQLGKRALADRPFRAVLAGPPNAGKSSLFNALAGVPAALVSPAPGTTRDYLVRTLRLGDVTVEVVDTAGLGQTSDDIDRRAQHLGGEQGDRADLVLWCVEAGQDGRTGWPTATAAPTVPVTTKADLAPGRGPEPRTSSRTGDGLDELRELLIDHARARRGSGLAPSLARCRHHVEATLRYLRAAHASVLDEEPAEILALELRGALDQLGEMVGAIYTDDLLDRVFSRFCIGK